MTEYASIPTISIAASVKIWPHSVEYRLKSSKILFYVARIARPASSLINQVLHVIVLNAIKIFVSHALSRWSKLKFAVNRLTLIRWSGENSLIQK